MSTFKESGSRFFMKLSNRFDSEESSTISSSNSPSSTSSTTFSSISDRYDHYKSMKHETKECVTSHKPSIVSDANAGDAKYSSRVSRKLKKMFTREQSRQEDMYDRSRSLDKLYKKYNIRTERNSLRVRTKKWFKSIYSDDSSLASDRTEKGPFIFRSSVKSLFAKTDTSVSDISSNYLDYRPRYDHIEVISDIKVPEIDNICEMFQEEQREPKLTSLKEINEKRVHANKKPFYALLEDVTDEEFKIFSSNLPKEQPRFYPQSYRPPTLNQQTDPEISVMTRTYGSTNEQPILDNVKDKMVEVMRSSKQKVKHYVKSRCNEEYMYTKVEHIAYNVMVTGLAISNGYKWTKKESIALAKLVSELSFHTRVFFCMCWIDITGKFDL